MNLETTEQRIDAELLAKRLQNHPHLGARVQRLLDLVENVSGDVRKANDAEQQARDELRKMGHEILVDWGQRHADDEATQLELSGKVIRQVKKKSIGTLRLAK